MGKIRRSSVISQVAPAQSKHAILNSTPAIASAMAPAVPPTPKLAPATQPPPLPTSPGTIIGGFAAQQPTQRSSFQGVLNARNAMKRFRGF